MANGVLPRGRSTSMAVSPTGPAKGVTSFNGQIGAVTSSDIPAGTITFSQLQNELPLTILGNPTGSSQSPSEVSLGITLGFSGTALQTEALTGDITSSANSFATTIANNAVTYAKIQNASAHSIIGNPTGSTANVSEITLGSGLNFSGTTLVATGSGGTVTSVAVSGSNGIGVSGSPVTGSGTIALSLGAITPTSVNGLTITTSTGTLTIANGKTGTLSNTLTFTGTDGSTVAAGSGGTIAYLATVQAFTKQQTLTPQALTSSGGHISWNANNGNNSQHTATENTVLDNPTNLVNGTVYTFLWRQNASAAKTLGFGSKWKFQGSSTVSVTLSSHQVFTGIYDSTDDVIDTVMTGAFS